MFASTAFKRVIAGLVVGSALAAGSSLPREAAAQAKAEQYFGIPSFRVGPFAAAGTGFFGGIIDYLNYVNATGGVNGVQMVFQECETEYVPARGVECYQRLLKRGNQQMHIFEPLSTPIAYGVLNRVDDDRVILTQFGYGRSDAADGRVFPWVFATMTSYWSGASAMINWIASREGGFANLKGKTITHLYLDNAYGREPLPVFRALAKKFEFTLQEVPVAVPGIEQQSQWLQIRQSKPDWVILWGFGAGMNSTALTSAARINFPRDRMLGIWWAGSEEDVIPAGDAAKGYFAIANAPAGRQFRVIQEIEKTVYGAGRGNLQDPKRIGTIHWNRGVVAGIFWVEAVRNAQNRFGKGQVMNGDQIRWGFENINLTPARMKELGIEGMMPVMRLSCEDHEGAGVVKVIQWDGTRWVTVTPDWVSSDRKMIRTMVEESAARYAAEQKIVLRDCAKEK